MLVRLFSCAAPSLAFVCSLAISSEVAAEDVASGVCTRPLTEGSSWIRLGGGVRGDGDGPRAIAELGGGTQLTFPLMESGDLRMGPFVEFGTSHFDASFVGGGPVIQLTGAPDDLDLFQFSGDGSLSLRLLAGYTLHEAGGGFAAGATMRWGYRAPFDLKHGYTCDPSGCESSEPRSCRRPYRYFTGVSMYVSTMRVFTGDAGYQVTAGIEFEPIGSFRYLFNLY